MRFDDSLTLVMSMYIQPKTNHVRGLINENYISDCSFNRMSYMYYPEIPITFCSTKLVAECANEKYFLHILVIKSGVLDCIQEAFQTSRLRQHLK